ncbi:hypothetical protein HZA39_02165 [Candidatus Peregrinibacteria bacterium]|nr:hypothetical protein [Candidatus Peregrinibacteria bacterium]
MAFFAKSFQEQLKAFLLELSVKHGLNETDLDKIIRMAYVFSVRDMKKMRKLANHMISNKLLDLPEENIIAALKGKF